jgi:5-methylcytosine-specific restriction protein A
MPLPSQPPEPGAPPWTDDEISAAVDAYFQLMDQSATDRPVDSKMVYRDLATSFAGRSPSMFENQLKNISFVLQELGCAWFQGLTPQRNNQRRLREILQNRLAARVADASEPTADLGELERRVDQLRASGSSEKPPPKGTANPERTGTDGSGAYARDPAVVAWVLDHAEGVCELCGHDAPFERSSGLPYLETHHVIPLANDGPDTIQNVAALCPNCHRRMHHGADALEQQERLQEKIEPRRR